MDLPLLILNYEIRFCGTGGQESHWGQGRASRAQGSQVQGHRLLQEVHRGNTPRYGVIYRDQLIKEVAH